MTEIISTVEYWFKALLVLSALALATNVLVGPSQCWRPVFISGSLVAAVACEYYYIFFAVMKVPGDWVDQTGVKMHRWDCRQSNKGGKRGVGDTSSFAINPCFCPYDGLCHDLSTEIYTQAVYCTVDSASTANYWLAIVSKNATWYYKLSPILHSMGYAVADEWRPPTTCPEDGTGNCYDGNQSSVPLYIDAERDCKNAQGAQCTQDEPCTPCDLESLSLFRAEGVSDVSRCRSCGVGNRGACNFVIDEGPYCWKSPWSTQVVPCTICCTEPEAIYYGDGACF